MYKPWTLNDSKKISAVASRFSGGFRGGSVCQEDVLVLLSLSLSFGCAKIYGEDRGVRGESGGPLVRCGGT